MILAHDFDLRAGRVAVALPALVSGVYNVICASLAAVVWMVLMRAVVLGGPGAMSEDFTIEGVVEL